MTHINKLYNNYNSSQLIMMTNILFKTINIKSFKDNLKKQQQ